MLLAHLADIHLGFRQYHRQTPSGINQREADVANAFRAAIDGVIAARPDVVVIAGDFFHAVRPTNAAIVFGFRQLQRLREQLPTARVIMVAGNHDTPRSVETGSILRLFTELGIEVVTDEEKRLVFPELDLSILAVPHQARVGPNRGRLRREGDERYHVLLIHDQIPGLPAFDRWWAEEDQQTLDVRELKTGQWSYVALGDYHVTREVAPMVWYAGALEYVTINPWGELAEERKSGQKGKHWLLVDLAKGTVLRKPIPPNRGVFDLKPIDAEGMGAEEVDREIKARLAKIPGGLADQLVRLVVYAIPRHVVRDLDHSALRAAKAKALHLHVDFRRPEVHRETGAGSPSRRQTLGETLRDYLRRRPLPERVDRERFVEHGTALLDAVPADPTSG